MKAGELDIERIAKNRISGHGRSEKVAWNLVKKITLDGKPDILERKVLSVNTTSPGVISNTPPIIVIGPAVRAEKAEAEFVTAKVAYGGRGWWGDYFL